MESWKSGLFLIRPMFQYSISFFVLLIAAAAVFLLSGCAGIYRKLGNDEYVEKNYSGAIKFYEKSVAKIPDYNTKRKLADCYYSIDNTVKAEPLYKTITDSSAASTGEILCYAKVLMSNGKYEEAKKAFQKYNSLKPDDGVAKILAAACDSAIVFSSAQSSFMIRNEFIGGFQLQLGVVPYKNGIVFSASKAQLNRKKTNFGSDDSYLDMYFMRRDSTGWGSPEAIKGEVNGPYHEGPATFTDNDTVMYFTRSNYAVRRLKKNNNNINTLKIFRSSLVNGEWKNMQELPFASADYSCGHPALSEDGKTMYFISDMPGGYGETDIYVTKLDGGIWNKPVNLGPQINTPGKELFPYFHSDTLYFSSDAHASIGGLDVFASHYNGTNWTEVKNMGFPINSSKDDFAFIMLNDNKTGYLSSNRNGQTDNIFSVTKKKKEIKLDSLAVKFYTLIKINDTVFVPAIQKELLNISTDDEKNVLLTAHQTMLRNRNDDHEREYAAALSTLLIDKMMKEQKSVLTRVMEAKKQQGERDAAEKADTLAARFFVMIHSKDTVDMPLIKDESIKAATKRELKMILESETNMLNNRNEANEKAYAKTLSTYVKMKKEVENIDIFARVEARKKKKNVIELVVNNKIKNRKKINNTTAENTVIAYNSIDPNRKKINKKIRKRVAASNNDDIRNSSDELQAAIAEIEQLYVANGSDPRSLLNEARNRNDIVIKSLLVKDRAERERILMLWKKTIANNMSLKYSQSNPLTELLNIIDAYDKLILYQKYDTTKTK